MFQYYGSIYYRAFKDISVGEELLAWYDEKYPQYFGIPYGMDDFSYLAESRCELIILWLLVDANTLAEQVG